MTTIAEVTPSAKRGAESKPPAGWTTWTPREEISPRFRVEAEAGRKGHSALRIDCDQAAAIGSWRHLENVQGGKTYRFRVYYRASPGVTYPRRCVMPRLDWLNDQGERVRPSDSALDVGTEGEWTKVEHIAAAPKGATRVAMDLGFGWCAKGTVWWSDAQIREEAAPPNRVVRVATIYHRPSETYSAEKSVQQFCQLMETAASQKPDIICLPEGITLIGTGKPIAEVSEPVPGPTTRALGAVAKKLRCYVVAGIYERVGKVIYNTAVLIGRDGEIAGKYRKTHLPREEVEAGLTPGDSYPVFKTDFGKIGILICWDVQFPEPSRALALQGAEMILLPIWGGSEVLAKARAIENHLFMISSSYDMKTFVVDPAGEVLAEATKESPVAVAELHLDRKILQFWIGDMKTRTWKERRPDIPAW